MDIKVAASILSADFGSLNKDLESVEMADLLHVDVMDGNFVKNISFGMPVLKWIKTNLPIDLHLMIKDVDYYLESFLDLKPQRIYLHFESDSDLRASFMKIIEYGIKPAIVINPKTPVYEVLPFLDIIDAVMFMSVEPGFGGQSFQMDVLNKVEELRARDHKINIAIDGGLNKENACLAKKYGANIIVAGSYIFNAKDRSKAIEDLKCH